MINYKPLLKFFGTFNRSKDRSKIYCYVLAGVSALVAVIYANYAINRMDALVLAGRTEGSPMDLILVELFCWSLTVYLIYIARDAYNEPPVIERRKQKPARKPPAQEDSRATAKIETALDELNTYVEETAYNIQLDQDLMPL